MPTPNHLPSVSASVCYKDPKAALKWLEEAFGFEPFMVILNENDELMHSEMRFGDGVWTLARTTGDFSPFEFSQRWTGTLADDGTRIEGTWEIAHDHETWEKDFDLVYTRVG